MFYICGKYKNRFLMKTVKLITCNDAMKAHILQGAVSYTHLTLPTNSLV